MRVIVVEDEDRTRRQAAGKAEGLRPSRGDRPRPRRPSGLQGRDGQASQTGRPSNFQAAEARRTARPEAREALNPVERERTKSDFPENIVCILTIHLVG
jgi:hypothetical protein